MLCFSPGSEFLFTGSNDRLVRVWEVRTGRLASACPLETRPRAFHLDCSNQRLLVALDGHGLHTTVSLEFPLRSLLPQPSKSLCLVNHETRSRTSPPTHSTFCPFWMPSGARERHPCPPARLAQPELATGGAGCKRMARVARGAGLLGDYYQKSRPSRQRAMFARQAQRESLHRIPACLLSE